MPNEVKLQPNIPLQLALQDPAGVPDGFRVHYQTTDGRTLSLPRPVAIELNELDLRPAESFVICRYRNPEGYSSLKVWLTAATEQQRALIEIATDDPTMTVPPQPETPGRVSGLKRKKTKSQDQPRLFDRGTGTYGPALQPLADSRPLTALSRIGGPIPMDLAFRRILGFVTDALKDAGEQWTDQAKQDAVSTCLIAAAKKGWLKVWDRP